uniref:1-phosphatidylinositol 4-kinase n=1 Tax=Steinernema glaseri TaxID=37863 RepID=A0A1I7Z5Y9_9BILA
MCFRRLLEDVVTPKTRAIQLVDPHVESRQNAKKNKKFAALLDGFVLGCAELAPSLQDIKVTSQFKLREKRSKSIEASAARVLNSKLSIRTGEVANQHDRWMIVHEYGGQEGGDLDIFLGHGLDMVDLEGPMETGIKLARIRCKSIQAVGALPCCLKVLNLLVFCFRLINNLPLGYFLE